MIKGLMVLLTSLWMAEASGQATPTAQQGEERLLIGQVALSERYIIFAYAGDLWRMGRNGGTAQQLTEGPFEDGYPAVSPDGGWVAFSRRGADDWDVYVISILGSDERQLTYHPEADIVRGWTPDGASVLFMSHRDEESVFRLYTIPLEGPFPIPLPLPRAWEGSFSPNGDRIAYVPKAQPTELFGFNWRYYRGGMTSPIWLAELDDSRIERVPRENSNDRYPMWMDKSVYFVSDRSGTFNLHVYDTEKASVEQLTDFKDHGIRHAAASNGVIAFIRDGRIHLYDTQTGETRTVPAEVDPDRSELERRAVSGAPYIQSASLSASGDRVVFGVRGEVVTFDPTSGEALNLTGTSGVAERYPTLSPDGKWLAYLSDESGEYELHIRSLADSSVKKIQIALRPTFFRELVWSPDSKHIAFSDKRLSLWVVDVETGGASRVATSTHSYQDRWHPAWSPDGAWLAYSKYESNRLRAIYLYHAERGRKRRITDSQTHAEHPVFDKNGKYLYLMGSNTAAMGEFGWRILSGVLFRPLVTRRLHMIILRDGVPSPIHPVIGQPNPAADSAAPDVATGPQPGVSPSGRGRRGQPLPDRVEAMRADPLVQRAGAVLINLRGIRSRVVPLPLPARDYADLAPGREGELYVLVTEWPSSPAPGNSPSRSLYRWHVSQPRELKKVIGDIDEFRLSADGTKILYRRGSNWWLLGADEEGDPAAGLLGLDSIQIEVDPKAEWRQMYHEAWRLMRDYFYDPNHHGQNLDALEPYYASYLPGVTRRRDLSTLLGRALGHISVSHLGVDGGDLPRPAGEPGRIGLLGADYEIERGRYRITKVYRSGPLNLGHPLLQAPLDQPGVRVRPGEYLLSVDGQRIDTTRNLYSYFAGKALKPVTIEVGPHAAGEDRRAYTVIPLPAENALRRWNWAERNRQMVDSLSNGVLGYVYVPNFSSGLEAVFGQLLSHADRRGLVIDQRFAGGGVTSDDLIEFVRRSPLFYYMFREGDDLAVPTNPLPRSKVLLINDVNASAAETFALMFKLVRIGKVVGTRTRGAGVGPYVFIPRLIDGGRIRIPNRAAYNPAGSWEIENEGVKPDIVVEWSPSDWRRGSDPQLEAAVKAALQQVIDNPPVEVKRPQYPTYK